jgi:hypothetical protein
MDDFQSAMLAIECVAAGIRYAPLCQLPGFATMGDIDFIEVTDVGLAQGRLALRTLTGVPLRNCHAAVGTFEGHACAIANVALSAIENPNQLVEIFRWVLFRSQFCIDPRRA